jgi:hypothetical protein
VTPRLWLYSVGASGSESSNEPQAKTPLLIENRGEVDAAADEDGNLSDVDDDDLEGMILNTSEVEKKTALWEEINKDYLLDQASRAQNDSGKLQALSRRKKDSKALSTADSAAEATRTVQ